ncbi:sensor histidine kinase [Bacillus massiliigorillae]|uniref:sensor histidine kinase n=1 Tax=Bacillus massiliigorillae TaxID=1243664 RepID=UPI0003A50793|nr:HAMP domain-containing sensor histidine kinase [Bacillus massiliigorillae]
MLDHLHKKLTFIFSACFVLIMLITILGLFFLFRGSLYNVAKQEVHDVLSTENKEFLENPLYITKYHLSGEYLFYFLTPENKLISNSHTQNRNLEKTIRKMDLKSNPTIITLADINDEKSYALSNKVLRYQDKDIGTLFVAKDISRIEEQIERWFYMLICIVIILLLVSIYVGNILAKRAILPIKLNIEKQRKFTADASHELRTPISVMLSSVEILEEQQDLSPFSREIVKDLKDEVKETHQLIETLLLLTKYESHQINFQKESYDLQLQIESIGESFQRIASPKKITVHKNEKSIQVNADHIQIKRLISIFLENAIKYTGDDGEIQILIASYEKDIVIQIKDNGIGIASKHLPHIFDRMYQVDTSRNQVGAGFGLAIAMQIIDYYKGTVDVKSTLGKGTTFIISLPIGG